DRACAAHAVSRDARSGSCADHAGRRPGRRPPIRDVRPRPTAPRPDQGSRRAARLARTRAGTTARGRGAVATFSTVTDTASTPNELWGGETRKAIANFPVSGEPIPAPVARWLGRLKAAAARTNAELGLLDADKAERIA